MRRAQSIVALVDEAGARLSRAGLDPAEARRDAELLARTVLDWDRAAYVLGRRLPAPATFHTAYEAVVARRAAREPVAYIRGTQEFWGREFTVTPAVLVPRPETELIIEEALALTDATRRYTIADVGTGSGCLAITLAIERPASAIVATDVSRSALAVADGNARRLHARSVRFVETDLLDGVQGPFDLVVSNPPYVRDGDRTTLPPEVRDHEPAAALFSGPDGLAHIRRLIPAAAAVGRSQGNLLFEIGAGQAEDVAAIVDGSAEWTLLGIRPDLQAIRRVVVLARR